MGQRTHGSKTFEARFENRPLVEEYLDEALSVVKNHGRVARRTLRGSVPGAAAINDVKQALDNPFRRR